MEMFRFWDKIKKKMEGAILQITIDKVVSWYFHLRLMSTIPTGNIVILLFFCNKKTIVNLTITARDWRKILFSIVSEFTKSFLCLKFLLKLS